MNCPFCNLDVRVRWMGGRRVMWSCGTVTYGLVDDAGNPSYVQSDECLRKQIARLDARVTRLKEVVQAAKRYIEVLQVDPDDMDYSEWVCRRADAESALNAAEKEVEVNR